MAMGRKPKPTILKLVSGDTRKDRINLNEPEAPGSANEPPKNMTDSQKEIWRRLIRDAPKGLIRRIDMDQFRLYVLAIDMSHGAEDGLRGAGLIVKTPGKKKTVINKNGTKTIIETGGAIIQHPLLGILNKQSLLIVKIGSELGFSPTSRTRISMGGGSGQSEKETNRFSKNRRA